MKNSFILYNNYQKHLSVLTLEQKGVLLDALFQYSESGETPELEPVIMMAFNFIAEDMDINRQKWEEMAEVRSEAGKKGAEARWKDHKKDSDNGRKMANDGKRILPMANDGKNAVNVNGNVNVNVNGNVNDIESTPSKKKQTIQTLLEEETVLELSKALNIDQEVVQREVEKMVDWLKSKGKRYKDYKAFARNWLRKLQPEEKPKAFASENRTENYGW